MNQELPSHSSLPTVINYFKVIDNEACHKYLSLKNGVQEKESYHPKKKIDIENKQKLEAIQQNYKEGKIEFNNYYDQLVHQLAFGKYGSIKNNEPEITDTDECVTSKAIFNFNNQYFRFRFTF